MFEPISKSIILGMIATGDTITKHTSISLTLVLTIIAATAYITNAMADTRNDINHLKSDVQEIKMNQDQILTNIGHMSAQSISSYDYKQLK